MEFKLQKVIDNNESIRFVEVEVFKNTNYEAVEKSLIERLGKYIARHGTDDSPNTWIRFLNSDDEYVLTCLGES